ncbi:STAS domain-containing protein [Paratractidigestivibacter sp.]|uniref:STAS domain-containing protein n=1 Tax=Paratractidigestivibacter sp. TaxID=2847316 RepID=UPI002ABDA214|nr:STAS domain-containing protein [Paratractidigestivibacter sp.]
MDIKTTTNDGAITVAPTGHLNTATAPELEEALQALDPAGSELVIDLTTVDYVSSAGLRVILGAKKRADAAGGTFAVANLCDDVREVFEITGLADVVEVR